MSYARRSLRRIALALFVSMAGAASATHVARADDPRGSWLEGRTYEMKESFTANGKTVEAYSAKLEDTNAEREIALYRFLVIEADTVAHAYSANVHPGEGETSRVELAVHFADAESAMAAIEIAIVPAASAYPTARRLVEDAIAVDELWTTASAALERAIGEPDVDARHPLAMATARVLERAYAAHPDHVGILHDLLTAYQLLLPFETGGDGGANISFLWRDRLRTYVRLSAGGEGAADIVGRLLTTCGLAEGCYALAWLGAAFATRHADPVGEVVVAMLAAVGQDQQALASDVTLPMDRGNVRFVVFRCEGEPLETGVPFHRFTVLTFGAASSEIPTPVWYSLTCERVGERRRWAFYGNVGGSRRLLRLFGAAEPKSDDVTAIISEQIRVSLDAAGKK